MVNVVACTHEEAADIAAKIQDFTTLPNRPFQQLVEVGELCLPSRDVRRHSFNLQPLESSQQLCELTSCHHAMRPPHLNAHLETRRGTAQILSGNVDVLALRFFPDSRFHSNSE